MVVYVGNYVNVVIAKRRGLTYTNPAASNRMARVASALRRYRRIVIVSPGGGGSSKGGSLFKAAFVSRSGQVPVVVAARIDLPILAWLCEPLFVQSVIHALTFRRRISVIIAYCYYPSAVAALLLARLFGAECAIEDLEDICEPRLADWRSEVASFGQQLIGWFLMKLALAVSDGAIIPSCGFDSAPARPILITGCLRPTEICLPKLSKSCVPGSKALILFGGKLDRSQGSNLLMEFLHIADQSPSIYSRFELIVCGYGPDSDSLNALAGQLANFSLSCLGFVSALTYREVLLSADICLVLQDPHGRYGTTKTPSKFYEYMGAGKLVVAPGLPDFLILPAEVVKILAPYSGDSLARLIDSLELAEIREYSFAASAFATVEWSELTVGARLNHFFRAGRNPNYEAAVSSI
jgi:hypothetical protein